MAKITTLVPLEPTGVLSCLVIAIRRCANGLRPLLPGEALLLMTLASSSGLLLVRFAVSLVSGSPSPISYFPLIDWLDVKGISSSVRRIHPRLSQKLCYLGTRTSNPYGRRLSSDAQFCALNRSPALNEFKMVADFEGTQRRE